MKFDVDAFIRIFGEGVMEYRGDGQPLRLNVTELAQNPLNRDSSLVETTAKLLQGLYDVQQFINQERAKADPPLPPIDFVQKQIGLSERGNAVHQFTVKVEVGSIFDAAIDPVG